MNLKRSKIKANETLVLYIFEKKEDDDELIEENASNATIGEFSFYSGEREILFFPFSCFEITKVIEGKNNRVKYFSIYLNYMGKYKKDIKKDEKIPENKFAKAILKSNILEKIEMNKETNKILFDFNMDKYITQDLKVGFIKAIYDITEKDINQKIQLLNYDESNKNEIEKKCNIYLYDKKIDFTFEYIFIKPGKYEFKFEFIDLLQSANKLFFNCNSLISVNVEKFKTNYINDMVDMFNGCCKLISLDLSNFKTIEVKSMKGMFKKCNALQNLDLSSFNTNKVNDMTEMFSECNSLTSLHLSNFKTENVIFMNRMFYKCTSLYYLNLSSFHFLI